MSVYHKAHAERQFNRHYDDYLPRFSFEQRRALPYGVWRTWDGCTVLFDRKYRPIFCRSLDGRVTRDDPARWVPGIRLACWFYDDACSPRRNRETLRRVWEIQCRWQAAIDGLDDGDDLAWLVPAEWTVNRKVKKPAD
jgi:hypothetical protein